MSELVRVGENTQSSPPGPKYRSGKSVSIFDRETEANLKIVSINAVSIPRTRTVACAS